MPHTNNPPDYTGALKDSAKLLLIGVLGFFALPHVLAAPLLSDTPLNWISPLLSLWPLVFVFASIHVFALTLKHYINPDTTSTQ